MDWTIGQFDALLSGQLFGGVNLAALGGEGGIVGVVLFYALAIMVVGSALLVAFSRNIVRTAMWLLFTLSGMAGLYLLLNAEFIAAVQIVVYVGGTLILVIFGIMLTSKNPRISYNPKRGEVLWAVLAGLGVVVPLLGMMVGTAWPRGGVVDPNSFSVENLGLALLDPGGCLAPFELVSVVLLAVMIGAAYLAKHRQASEPGAGKSTDA